MTRRTCCAILLVTGGWLSPSVPAIASEPVVEAFARLYEGLFEGDLSGWQDGSLVDLTRDPDGRGIAYTISDCVVRRLHLDATPDHSPRMSVASFDLKKIERVRFIADDKDYMTDKTLPPLDPSVTMIMLEGPQWQCGIVMSLESQLGGFDKQCEDRYQFAVVTDDQRQAAKAAIEVMQAACMKDAGRKP